MAPCSFQINFLSPISRKRLNDLALHFYKIVRNMIFFCCLLIKPSVTFLRRGFFPVESLSPNGSSRVSFTLQENAGKQSVLAASTVPTWSPFILMKGALTPQLYCSLLQVCLLVVHSPACLLFSLRLLNRLYIEMLSLGSISNSGKALQEFFTV